MRNISEMGSMGTSVTRGLASTSNLQKHKLQCLTCSRASCGSHPKNAWDSWLAWRFDRLNLSFTWVYSWLVPVELSSY